MVACSKNKCFSICFYLFLFYTRMHDIILRVNDTDYTDIDHQPAVDTLKATKNEVHLVRSIQKNILK